MPGNKREIGSEKERIAGAWLEKKGHRILEYNFRTRMAEADVISLDGDTYVFTEVKYRRTPDAGTSAGSSNSCKAAKDPDGCTVLSGGSRAVPRYNCDPL